MIDLRLGDCIEVLRTLPDNSVDSIVTDPPYGIGFMNKEWDSPQKHKELIERETKRSEERFKEGKSPAKGGFSKGVQPGLAIGGAKEGRWFQEWCEIWAEECFRVLKPGGHILSFSAPRTYHRMATAFEEVGFQVRDQIMWVFGSGFPKSHNIGKAIQKQSGDIKVVGKKTGMGTTGNSYVSNNEEYIGGDKGVYKKEYDDIEINNDWEGWGTALKPAHEPICMARKPLSENSIAENVLKWGTGGINIDGCRIEYSTEDTEKINFDRPRVRPNQQEYFGNKLEYNYFTDENNKEYNTEGRFPANIMFDEEAGKLLDEQSGVSKSTPSKGHHRKGNTVGDERTSKGAGLYGDGNWIEGSKHNDKGGASRFFYCPKVSKKERNAGLEGVEIQKNVRPVGQAFGDGSAITDVVKGKGNTHPTVKPIKLMEYLIKLVTPPNGVVLEPFMGSGSTGIAAKNLGMSFIGIEKEQEYFDIAKQRIGE